MSAVVVFDTNILVSAFRSPGGSPARCIALARAGQIRSLTCREILDELHDKLMVKFAVPLPDADAAVKDIESFSTIIGISNTLKVIAADPDDDKIIECAVVGQATHIVTGDKKHLLPLGSYQGIQIITAAALLALLVKP